KQNRDEDIFQLIKLIDKSKWVKNIKGIKHAKLLINCATASFGLISGLTLGEILDRKYMRMAFLILITEGVQICEALNIKLEKINMFDFQTLALLPNNPFSLEKKDEILKFIGNQYKELRSSSLASWERGEKSEIPFLNGYFVEKGKQLNLPVPLNELILETCMAIENGKKKPSINEMLLFETKVKEILENYL
ncbi:MAG: ketopantoate reductase family protein, partial [Promethearchaeota archaeon]